MSLIVAKLGSSTLVDGDGELREEVIDARVADLARARAAGFSVLLVSSGAIACGLGRLRFARRPSALADLQAASAVGQGTLFHRYDIAFTRHGLTPAQVLLTSADLEGRATYLNARTTLQRLLALGVVPVINENDTTATDELTFGDNDVLAAQVAILLHARLLVLLTDRDGLYRPGADGPELIGRVPADVSPEDLDLASMGGSGRGRGGVRSKIAAAGMATAAGIACAVASGTEEGAVLRLARGEDLGTRFDPGARDESSFKLWLRHAKPAMGSIRVDDGALRALRARGTSLLAVGVVGCEGAFAAGDAVEVTDAGGRFVVGKGIAAVSAEELRRVAGMKSDDVRRALPGAPEEVIHRDRFVLRAAGG